MTEKAQQILDSKNLTVIGKKELEEIVKDRLDFGFDSIYFRYATVVDELAVYKAQERAKREHISFVEAYERESKWYGGHKMHFYHALEQFVHAHPQEDEKCN